MKAPGSGDADDAPVVLDAPQASDLAQADSSGQVSSEGRVLTEAEGTALFDQIQQASVAKGDSGPEPTGDVETHTAAVTGRAVTPMNVMLETRGGHFAQGSIWYYVEQWGGWFEKPCVALPRTGTWKDLKFTVPNDVDVIFNGFRPGAKCIGGKPDLQVVFDTPAKPTTKNWWVQVF